MGSSTPDGFDNFEQFLKEWSRRDFLRGMGGVAAFAAFTAGGLEFLDACGNSGSSSTQTTAQGKKGGHLVEANISDISVLNSVLSSDTASGQVISMLFEGLLVSKPNGDLVPGLASAMPQVSSDGKTYTFKLRPNLKWSDGQPLTSDDVLFTFNMMFAPEYKAVNSPRRSDLTLNLDSNTADFNSGPPASSGAFKFVRWDKGQQVVLARNENYWRGQTYLDQYIIKVVPDSVTLTNQLKTGEVDFGFVDPSVWDGLATVDNIDRLTPFGVPTFTFFGYNLDPAKPAGKLFQDVAVR